MRRDSDSSEIAFLPAALYKRGESESDPAEIFSGDFMHLLRDAAQRLCSNRVVLLRI